MVLEIILALFLGIISGIITGLTPGLHINLVALISLILAPSFNFNPILIAIFVISLSITHTFLDFIPSIFLGCPSEDSVMSVLPGHKLLQKGKGYFAVRLTLIGSYIAVIVILIISPFFLYILPLIQEEIKLATPFILILISLLSLLSSKKVFPSFLIFIFAGILGIVVLNLQTINQPLFPLFTGFFGISSLVLSLKDKYKIPMQTTKVEKIKYKSIFSASLLSLLISPFCSLMPGLGAAQSTLLASFFHKLKTKSYLIFNGAVNTIVMGISFIVLYSLNKTRTGSAVILSKLPELPDIKTTLIIIIISASLSFIIGDLIAKSLTNHFYRLNYNILSIFLIILLTTSVFIVSGYIGLVVLITSVSLGIITIISKVPRAHLMACLIIPTILYYL